MEDYLTESDYQIAKENGLARILVYRRVYECGWDVERAITEPVNEKHRPTGAWERWQGRAVVSHQLFRTRLSRGWSEDAAALTPAKKARGRAVNREILDVPYLVAATSMERMVANAR